MNSYEITFSINDTDKIVVPLTEHLSFVHCCYNAPIQFVSSGKKIILNLSDLQSDMESLSYCLEKALKNELPLHESITKDIGFLCNQYYKNSTGFVENSFSNGYASWVGNKNGMWEGYNTDGTSNNTWLYNDNDGNIILNITPFFFHFNKQKVPPFLTFKQWLLRYKPYYTTIISKKTALNWFNQVNMITQTIDENNARWIAKEEEHRKK